jgi:hypothetical protein
MSLKPGIVPDTSGPADHAVASRIVALVRVVGGRTVAPLSKLCTGAPRRLGMSCSRVVNHTGATHRTSRSPGRFCRPVTQVAVSGGDPLAYVGL